MDVAGPLLQLWLAVGLGADTAGYAPVQLTAGLDACARDRPLRAGAYVSYAHEDPDQLRIGFGGELRYFASRWLVAGAALEFGSQERDGGDRVFVSLDVLVGVPITVDGRVAAELDVGLQGEKEIALLGGPAESLSSAHASARVVLRL